MKCPYCNGEMDKGYIESRDYLYWSDHQRALPAIPPVKGIWIPFEREIVAHRCRDCKKLVIDYGEEK